jgi:hypothetical protein
MALGDFGILSSTPDLWAHVNRPEVEQEMIRAQAQMYQAAQAQQAGTWMPGPSLPLSTPPNAPAVGTTLSTRAREMFLKRMGGIRAEMHVAAEDFVHCHIHGETVYLFYCFAGRDGCVKEPIDLFPSDQLITQFRMILS